MKFTRQEIEHLADLANLRLSEAEKTKYEPQLSSVLDYVGKLAEIEQAAAQLTGSDAVNVFREDAVAPSPAEVREAVISNFPARQDDLLEVPAVFGEAKEDF